MTAAAAGEEYSRDLTCLPGIGTHRARLLKKLGVEKVKDLLFLMPRTYRRYRFVPIGDVQEGDNIALSGMVKRISVRQMRRRLGTAVTAKLADATGTINAVWYNQGHVAGKLREGQWLVIEGKVRRTKAGIQLEPERFEEVDEEEGGFLLGMAGRTVVRVAYPLTEGLTQRMVARAVETAMDLCLPGMADVLPDGVLARYGLPSTRNALKMIHRPQGVEEAEVGRRRFVFEELFVFCIALLARKRTLATVKNDIVIRKSARVTDRIEKRLPFRLTKSQRLAVEDIERDMAGSSYMNRLLQGDVGMGKTLVAFYAMLLVIAAKKQVAVLAPTEILAHQHYEVLSGLLEKSRVGIEYLSSSVRSNKRRQLLEGIASGGVDLVVGTHAILEKEVQFRALGLAVMDEQHRFGVHQRGRLRQKGGDRVHTLLMTATPIPRTLALTLYGDLDITVLDEYPPGRGETVTKIVPDGMEDEMWSFVRSRAGKGELTYVVVPLVEESEKLDVASALSIHDGLANGPLSGVGVGLVHGRMNPDEKRLAMRDFRSGKTRVLVSTVVIEVGIDVSEATLIVVMNAERFGLSQLHQLRGRVGRGHRKSYCFLVPGSRDEQVMNKLRILERTNDGFVVAEEDFKIRGMGEFFGDKQHGRSGFLVARLPQDYDILAGARRAAADLLEQDPQLQDGENRALRHHVLEKYGATLRFLDIG